MDAKQLIELAKLLGCYVYHYDKDYAEKCYYQLVGPSGFDDPLTGPERKTEAEAWADAENILTGEGMLAVQKQMADDDWVCETCRTKDSAAARFFKLGGTEGADIATDELPEAVALAAYAALGGGTVA